MSGYALADGWVIVMPIVRLVSVADTARAVSAPWFESGIVSRAPSPASTAPLALPGLSETCIRSMKSAAVPTAPP